MIKIIRADEPLTTETVVVTIYGAPGVGKTTLGFSAERPLLLDFDDGARRAANRKDTVVIREWGDIHEIRASDLETYDTIVVDTVGRCLDVLALDIINRNPKLNNNGALTLQGFGQLKSRFITWTKMLRSFGKDLVLIAHSTEDKGDARLIERLDMQGASKNEVHKISDAMGRVFIEQGNRFLDFRPGETFFGKNPANFLEPIEVPPIVRNPKFLAEVIDQIKKAMNSLTEEQRARMDAVENWRLRVQEAKSCKEVNDLIGEAKALPENIKKACKVVLADHAKSLGLVFDRSTAGYVEPKEPVE